MASVRFYLPEFDNGNYSFSAEEAQHICAAKRMRVGEQIEVFNGKGSYQEVVITGLRKRWVLVEPVNEIITIERVSPQIEMAVAVPKGKRLQYMIEKLVELGVAKITPLLCQRSVAGGDDPVDKYRRWAIEACKQSRNLWIPEFSRPLSFEECILSAVSPVFMADYTGCKLNDNIGGGLERCLCLIGPEGGFSAEEFSLAQDNEVIKNPVGSKYFTYRDCGGGFCQFTDSYEYVRMFLKEKIIKY